MTSMGMNLPTYGTPMRAVHRRAEVEAGEFWPKQAYTTFTSSPQTNGSTFLSYYASMQQVIVFQTITFSKAKNTNVLTLLNVRQELGWGCKRMHG
jgi:hypothetical protein